MKIMRNGILGGVLFLIPMTAVAQSPTQNPGEQPASNPLFRKGTSEKQPGSQSQSMYEDIEIMRRIMNRKLGLWPNLVAMNSNCALCHVVSGNHVRNSQGQFVDVADDDLHANLFRERLASSRGLGVGLADFSQ